MSSAFARAPLGDVLRIKHGFAFKGQYFAPEGEYVVLTPGSFEADGGLKRLDEETRYYTDYPPPEFVLKRDELLVVMTDLTQKAPILGSPAFIPVDNKYLHNQRLGKVIDIDESRLDRQYAYYLFNLGLVRDQIKATATGATVKHTAPERIYQVEVPLPDLPIQKRIVSILRPYDALVEVNEKRMDILEELVESVYREWFVNGSQNGGLDRLGDIALITMGQSPPSDYYNFEGEGLPFHQGVKDFGRRFPTTRVYCTAAARVAEAGDILFSVRAPVGRINVADRKIALGRGVAAIRSKNDGQAYLLRSLHAKFHAEDLMGGGTVFQAVTNDDMQRIELRHGNDGTVKKFEAFAQPVDRYLRILTWQNESLIRTRDFLLPRLMLGRVAIDDDSGPEAR